MNAFTNRHVVITGGTGALGTAVVDALREAGAICHVPTRATLGDVADEAAVSKYYEALPELWASIHIAGGFASASIGAADKAFFAAQLESNLMTAYVCSRAAVAKIRQTGGGGRIVNVAARQALEPRLGAGSTAYTVSKAAVAALTTALGQELAKEGILFNAVAPSTLDTPANRASMPDADFSAWPKVAEVAAVVLFLASPANQVARSAVLPVYGKA